MLNFNNYLRTVLNYNYMSYKSSCKKSWRVFKEAFIKFFMFLGKGFTTGKWEGKIEIKF